MDKLIDGLMWYIVFIFSITFHEAAHALISFKLGDRTAHAGGQVSLDPIPHIRREPLGTVVIPIISFLLGGWMIGWASTPYDPLWAMRFPKRSALMSLAGPAANLILVIFAFVLIRLGVMFNIFYAPDSINFSHITAATSAGFFNGVAAIISILFSLNLILCFFNLLPLPPLDGSGVIPLMLDEQMAHKYMDIIQSRTFAFIGLIVAWKLFGYVFSPIHLFVINLLYPGAGYH
jgi:Zn-dependent protease